MNDTPRITLGEILAEQGEVLQMRLIAGERGLHRYIDHSRVQNPSLAFAGFLEHLNDYRLQVIGQTELHYLTTLSAERQQAVIDAVFDLRLAGVVVTRGVQPPEMIVEAARRTDTPLLVSACESSNFMTEMTLFLSRKLAPKTWQHGVFVDIYGLGVLLTGKSGIGKSEIGLELISRGHRLIADDMVEFSRATADVLVGQSPELLRYHMELRGLGIINIRELYGAASITDAKRLSLIIELCSWKDSMQDERMIASDQSMVLHQVSVPYLRIPIRPGRSLAVIIEVATRNQLLKQRGMDSHQDFIQNLDQQIAQNTEREG